MKRHPTTRRGSILAAMAILMLIALGHQALHAQENAADEYEIRAAMLFNMTRFVDWPSYKMSDPNAPFVICVLGSDSMTPSLESLLRGRTYAGRQVTSRRLNKHEGGEACHILYVSHSERKRFEELAPSLAKAAVLTVGDQEWFASAGGIIGLPLIDSRVRIEINLGSAQRSGLNVSSRLLRLASVVR